MEHIRDGTTTVFALKIEIRKSLKELRKTCYRSRIGGIVYLSRVERQIEDGEKFLSMLNYTPYSNCKTVDQLKQKISRERNKIKKLLAKVDTCAEGHQVSIFEILDVYSEEERKEKEKNIEALKEEIHWLHKCLGICKSKDYFNLKYTGK